MALKFRSPFKGKRAIATTKFNARRRTKSEHLTGVFQAYGVLVTFLLGIAAGRADTRGAFILTGLILAEGVFTALWLVDVQRHELPPPEALIPSDLAEPKSSE